MEEAVDEASEAEAVAVAVEATVVEEAERAPTPLPSTAATQDGRCLWFRSVSLLRTVDFNALCGQPQKASFVNSTLEFLIRILLV